MKQNTADYPPVIPNTSRFLSCVGGEFSECLTSYDDAPRTYATIHQGRVQLMLPCSEGYAMLSQGH